MLTTKGEDTGVYIENLDIDSLIRRTITPTHDSVADPDFAEALRNSRVGREFPIIARFLPKSERFFEHLMLLLQKQEEVSGWVGGMLRKSKQDEAYKSHLKTVRENRILSATINDERTKRIIMDARTASVFSETGEPPPTDWHSKLRTPFDWFYLEFSDPVMIGEQEYIPDTEATKNLEEGDDYVRAMLIRSAAVNVQTPTKEERGLCNIIVFLTDEAGHHTRRAFLYDLSTGKAMTRVKSLRANHSVLETVKDDESKLGASAVETEHWEYDISEIPQEFLDKVGDGVSEQFIMVGEPMG